MPSLLPVAEGLVFIFEAFDLKIAATTKNILLIKDGGKENARYPRSL